MNVDEKDVIVAEDDYDDLFFFEHAMKEIRLPLVIRHAKNGDVLFALLKEKIPHLLFLDIHMPCKDGISCVKEIRQHKEYDGMTIIMYTSEQYNKSIEECYRNGANFYLVKPDKFSKLTELLTRIFLLDSRNFTHYPHIDQFVLR